MKTKVKKLSDSRVEITVTLDAKDLKPAREKALEKLGRENSVCARVGGDEYICAYMEESNLPYSAEQFGERMEAHIREMEGAADKPYPISASVGMIIEKVGMDMDLDAVINRADDLMYEQKTARKKRRN